MKGGKERGEEREEGEGEREGEEAETFSKQLQQK